MRRLFCMAAGARAFPSGRSAKSAGGRCVVVGHCASVLPLHVVSCGRVRRPTRSQSVPQFPASEGGGVDKAVGQYGHLWRMARCWGAHKAVSAALTVCLRTGSRLAVGHTEKGAGGVDHGVMGGWWQHHIRPPTACSPRAPSPPPPQAANNEVTEAARSGPALRGHAHCALALGAAPTLDRTVPSWSPSWLIVVASAPELHRRSLFFPATAKR